LTQQLPSQIEQPRDRWVELIAAVLLSMATVLTAWSGYQATRWSGVQATAFSRARLRGYEWVTVCPGQLAERLGDVQGLLASGAFVRVAPLRAGGVLLQASDTIAGYDEQIMRRVFRALVPVLPVGHPCPDPEHPRARVVYENAADYAG
jgi:hypothetical protein